MRTANDLQMISAADLQDRVGGLVGERFDQARTSYGDELRLSFGQRSVASGKWELGTRAAKWVLLGGGRLLGRDSDGRDGVAAMQGLADATVESVDAMRSDRTLVLAFNTGHYFVVMPNKPHRTKDDLDLWELFSPYGWWVAVRRDGAIEVVPDAMSLVDRQERRKAA